MPPKSILLINPPVAKPCEPPAGIAKLAGDLRANGIDYRLYDANIDSLLGLLDRPVRADDTWTKRARRQLRTHLGYLRSLSVYNNRDRYKRAVMDVNRILSVAGRANKANLSLCNHTAAHLSALRSTDLLKKAQHYAQDPFFPYFSRALVELLDQWEPDVFGLSITFMSQALSAFSMMGFIKQQFPHKKIVCGGGLVTSWLGIPGFQNPFAGLVDELVQGPGGQRVVDLCTEGGQSGVPVSPITGYDFSGFDLQRYLSPLTVLPYSTSRGCYWKKCAFCPEKAENQPYQTDTPSNIIADLRQTIAKTSAGIVHFLDNALSPRLMRCLMEQPPKANWYGFARFSRHLADPDFAIGLKRSGCAMLKLGVESGDPAVLDRLQKGIDLQLVANALSNLHGAGIATYVYLLFGTPPENEKSAAKTMAFTAANAANIDFLNLSIFNLPAYNQDAKALDTEDFYAGDLSLYRNFIHPLGWHRDRVRHFLAKTFRKPAAIQRIIANDPPFFTSNHAPFYSLVV